ncbi:hypothetical protein FUA26_01350 [Seonamhaeicola algicola]|uniref:Uncharacterized protein n=1 Tax=Seonamhaeicola algicola TaxID=1719036 RepID=A0A5C7BBA7_9FLAO|nr:hypothetical protein [Seonamhaeicola algicola]TXE15182.1 hypothetical protein FUA26_01350 [Seonamhaeicola algicola]
MKKIFFLPFLASLILFASCSSDDDASMDDHNHHDEHKNVSLLISDTESKTLNFINPFTDELKKFEAAYAKGSIYATESGRYAVITHRNDNFTETFNIGGEIDHGDHSHDLGETGLAAVSFVSQKPTHFKSEQGYVAVYNDGDATLSIFNEKTIDNNATVNTITTGSAAHHGAMVIFKNCNIAITNLGNGSGLPEKVQIINQSGEIVSEEAQSLSTSGIHGSAGNNTTAVFGSGTGILVVNDNGEQNIINYPDSFEDGVWFGSLLATNISDLFIGYTSSKGAYFIDIENEAITPIHETTELFKCMVSKSGKEVISLTKSGVLKITDVATKAVLFNETLSIVMDTESTGHGSVTSSIDYFDEFVYISVPSAKKIIQYNIDDMKITEEFELAITPYQFKVLAYDIEH